MKRIWVRRSALDEAVAEREALAGELLLNLEDAEEKLRNVHAAREQALERLRRLDEARAYAAAEAAEQRKRADELAAELKREQTAPRRIEYTGDGNIDRLVEALVAIRDETVPILASPGGPADVVNVHIPGSYADRVRSIADAALKGD